MVLATVADKRATSVFAVTAGPGTTVARIFTAHGISACVAQALLVPAVAQALDIVALVLGMVARLVAVGLQVESVVPTSEDVFFKVTHYDKEYAEESLTEFTRCRMFWCCLDCAEPAVDVCERGGWNRLRR